VERARLVTQSYRETEGKLEIIRRATALAKVLDNMSIYINEGELIVGNNSSAPRASTIAPEFHSTWMVREIEDPRKAPDKRTSDVHIIKDKVKKELKEEILPYWYGKTVEDRVVNYLPQEIIDNAFPSLSKYPNIPSAPEIFLRNGMGHLNVNYNRILTQGALGIITEVKKKLEQLNLTAPGALDKRHFYEAVIIAYDAMIRWSRRYVHLARQIADREENSQRKMELERIMQICERVPAYPVKTFWEAIQSFWFTQLVLFGLEQDDTAVSPGRFDQYMYPFYKQDIESGKITKEEGLELLECLFVKMSEMGKWWDYTTATYFGGFSLTQCIVLGGVTPEGEDSTNELSYLILEAEKQIGLFQPELAVRVHKDSPHDFLIKAAEVIKLGRGKPKLFMDETAIPMMLNQGVSLKEARDYCVVGCVEISPSGSAIGWTNAAQFNLAKCLELALNNGNCRLTGMQIGLPTGNPKEFTSFYQVVEAFQKQVEYFIKQIIIAINACLEMQAEYTPYPFTSALVDGCLDKGMDVTRGGAKYNYIGVQGVAVPDVADSLAALKKLVFEEKAISMSQLIDALDNDFDGHENLRQMLINKAPKYGNDEDSVDKIARQVGQIFCKEISKYHGPLRQPYFPGLFTVSAHIPLGHQVGALPSGRKARAALADGGISSSHGVDRNGPTALIKSVAKIDHLAACNGTLLNLRFSLTALKNQRDLSKFVSFIKTYNAIGGFHIQFNVIDSKILNDAKKYPGNYKGLMVRVAGYSAYFTELDPEVQDDIISRTEQVF
jgi:formate C-acetyltransferase